MRERAPARYRWVVLTFGTLAFSTSYFVRTSHAGIARSLQSDLHLDKQTFGYLSSAFFYAYALAQIPWGALTDRLGGRIVVAGGTLLTGLAITAFAYVTDLSGAMTARAAAGLFSASVFVPMAAVCARWFPSRERGTANSLYHGVGGGLGQFIALSVIPVAAAHSGASFMGFTGWRRSILFGAAFVLIAGALAAVFVRAAPRGESEQIEESKDIVQYSAAIHVTLRDPRLGLLVGVFISFTMTIRLVQNWMQVYAADLLIARHGFTVEAAQVRAAVVGLGLVLGTTFGEPLFGKLSDAALRHGIARGWLMAASLASKLCAFFLLLLHVPHPMFYAVIACFIGAVGNSAPIVSAAASEFFGARVAGFAMGVVNTVGQLMGAFALTLSGWLAMNLSKEPGNLVAEYMPIWWLGIGCSTVGIVSGVALARLHNGRKSERDA